jgi:DNA-binding transcriptional MocR family regulator
MHSLVASHSKLSCKSDRDCVSFVCMTAWTPALPPGTPLYLGLADAIAGDVAGGALLPGGRLPTQRELASRLRLAVSTVTRAYAEAERRGLISSEVGRGTFVRHSTLAPLYPESDGAAIDLRGNFLLPWPLLGELRQGLARTAESGPEDEIFGYAPHRGLPRHRAAGARLAAGVGVPATVDRILVTAGVQHAMTVVFSTLLAPGDTLLVEELTYTGMRSLAQLLGLRLRPVRMDAEGILPDDLEAACRAGGAKALYCMPVLQNPTAAVMSARRCRDLAEIAARCGLPVVEDDSYGFLLPEAPRLAALLPDSYWLTGTSKSVLPTLRVGFVCAPPPAVGRLEAAIGATVYLASPLVAETVARWVEDGTYARVQQWKRQEVLARQEIARRAFDGLRYAADPCSPHGWLSLPEPWTAADAVARAAARGVRVTPAEAFAVGRDIPRAVRICLGPVPERAALERALAALAAMLRDRPDPGSIVA